MPKVPASAFAMVLGLSGLSNAWRAAHEVWGLPPEIGEALALLTTLVWVTVAALYVAKWVIARKDALDEAADPVQCCFVGLAGVATMLASVSVLPHARALAVALFAAGAAFTLGFAIWRTGALWQGGRDLTTTTPVLYLPAGAGSFVTAIAASALGLRGWGQLAFGAGLFSWLALESVVYNRLLNAPAMAPALRPTLGVQLAPPPVAALAYLSATDGPPDVVAHALFGYALLQALLLIRLLPWVWQGSFKPSYWAYTFGATALAAVPLRLVQRGDAGPVAQLAPVLFVAANLLVGMIAVATVRGWLRRPVAAALAKS